MIEIKDWDFLSILKTREWISGKLKKFYDGILSLSEQKIIFEFSEKMTKFIIFMFSYKIWFMDFSIYFFQVFEISIVINSTSWSKTLICYFRFNPQDENSMIEPSFFSLFSTFSKASSNKNEKEKTAPNLTNLYFCKNYYRFKSHLFSSFTQEQTSKFILISCFLSFL